MRKRFFPLVVCASLMLFPACKKPSSGDAALEADDGYDKKALLTNWGENIMLPALADFESNLSAFSESLAGYCGELGSGTFAEATLAGVKTKFAAAMAVWQELEMMQVGPVAMNAYAYRNDIYAWPLISTCGIDREVALAATLERYSLTDSDNRKGLGAVEYLLFNTNLNHTCTSTVPETADWDAKPDLEKRKLRCDFAKIATADVTAVAATIATEWRPDGKNFVGKLTDGSEYRTLREAVNAFSDAVFYVDKETKDMKIAYPAGISDRCDKDSCPELVEHPYADISRQSVVANIKAFRALLAGEREALAVRESDQPGFADYLTFLGRDDLATDLLTKTDALLGELTNESAEFTALATGINPADCAASTSTDRKVELCALHADIKAVTDVLKTELISVLDLEAPARAEGDND